MNKTAEQHNFPLVGSHHFIPDVDIDPDSGIITHSHFEKIRRKPQRKEWKPKPKRRK